MSAGDAEDAGAEARELFAAARDRGRRMGLAYAGAVTPAEAHRLHAAGAAAILDVRTPPEWELVGHVPGAPLIEWPRSGSERDHAAFIDAVRGRFAPEAALLFLCRSGVRSHYAAELASRAGFRHAYNILEGFEGEHGEGRNGWRAAGLPWQTG